MNAESSQPDAEGPLHLPPGSLYVVATPIGNLGDFAPRARAVLAAVDAICAEDTRTSAPLLRRFGIHARLLALHEHNEDRIAATLVERLQRGERLALISDAGTPLISDPGYALVSAARAAGLPVYAVPGPSAALAALSISGLPSDRFVFEGFLPPKPAARRQRLRELAAEPRTLVIFESAHRIEEAARDCAEVLGQRTVCLCRELTKRFEQSVCLPAVQLPAWLAADPDRRRGEFVLVVAGAPAPVAEEATAQRLLRVLLKELPPSAASRLAAELTGLPKGRLYRQALAIGARSR